MKTPIVFLTLVSGLVCLFQLAASKAACSQTCTDYHRLCPAVNDPAFFNEYKAKKAAGQLPDLSDKELPDMECTNEEVKVICPMSCIDCVPCSKADSDYLKEQLKALKEELKEMEKSGAFLPQEEGLIPVLGSVADPAYHGHTQTTIDKAFEGIGDCDTSHCYISDNPINNQASISIRPSTVTKLEFLNRADCCSDWLAGIEVKVCERGGVCQFCGIPPNVAPGAWSTAKCAGALRGNEIRLKNNHHHLQFCELKIYGTPLPEDTFVILHPIAVKGYVADPAFHGHPYTTIDKAFEGSNSLDDGLCYISDPNGKSQATIEIEPAQVVQLQLLNRHGCCTDWQQNIEVRICVKGISCQMCGKPPAVVAGAWSYLDCQGQLEGNEIQLYNPVNHLQFCELNILGIPLPADKFVNLEKLHITGMLADPAFHGHPHTTIDKAFEGSNSLDGNLCYIANSNGKSHASIDVEPAEVYQIQLLNRKDCCTDWMDTIQIKVCVKGGTCHVCGYPAAVAAGSWATINCQGGPIEGNEIQMYNPTHHLQFCEMIVYGKPVANPTFPQIKMIRVTGFTGSDPWPGHPTTTIDKAFEGSDNAHGLNCFVSKTPTGGDWAKVDIESATVYQIKLLNRVDCCDLWMDTIEIKVCDKTSGACNLCGKPAAVAAGNWATITCTSSLKGNEIQLVNPKHHLQFCEMRVLGIVDAS